MLKLVAFIVIAFFVTLWASGSNLHTFKDDVDHWADESSTLTGADPHGTDWGSG
jgi:hypothetical protein